MGINRISTYLPSSRSALLRRCCDGARRAAASFLPVPSRFSPPFSSPDSRPLFVFHLFAGRAAAPGRMEIFRGGIISGHVFRARNAPMHRARHGSPSTTLVDRRGRLPARTHPRTSLAFSRERATAEPPVYLTSPSPTRSARGPLFGFSGPARDGEKKRPGGGGLTRLATQRRRGDFNLDRVELIRCLVGNCARGIVTVFNSIIGCSPSRPRSH